MKKYSIFYLLSILSMITVSSCLITNDEVCLPFQLTFTESAPKRIAVQPSGVFDAIKVVTIGQFLDSLTSEPNYKVENINNLKLRTITMQGNWGKLYDYKIIATLPDSSTITMKRETPITYSLVAKLKNGQTRTFFGRNPNNLPNDIKISLNDFGLVEDMVKNIGQDLNNKVSYSFYFKAKDLVNIDDYKVKFLFNYCSKKPL